MTLATGEIRPKDQAADWALARLPKEHRRVLAHARAAYLGEEREDWRELDPFVGPHVNEVVKRVRRLLVSGGANGGRPPPTDEEEGKLVLLA